LEREEGVVCALQGVLGSYEGQIKEKGFMIFFSPRTGREIQDIQGTRMNPVEVRVRGFLRSREGRERVQDERLSSASPPHLGLRPI